MLNRTGTDTTTAAGRRIGPGSAMLVAAAAWLAATGQAQAVQIADFDFASGNDGGFVSSGAPTWAYTGTQWQTQGQANTQNFLTSPTIVAGETGVGHISLTHAYSFRYFQPNGDYLDAGVLELSLNGGAFAVITPFGGYPPEPFGDGCDGLDFIPACWGDTSAGFVTDTFNLGTINLGDSVQFRFHSGWQIDIANLDPVSDFGWTITSTALRIGTLTDVPDDTSTAVPAPGGIALFGLGTFALGAATRRRYR